MEHEEAPPARAAPRMVCGVASSVLFIALRDRVRVTASDSVRELAVEFYALDEASAKSIA